MKRCTKCGDDKPIEHFNKKLDAVRSICKVCQNIENKIYRMSANFKTKRNKYLKDRRKSSIKYRIENALRCRLRSSLKGKNKNRNAFDLLGCDIDQFILYIESKFKNVMTWDNYGKWHIDHIKPCASFNLQNVDDQIECFNYKNLQPLWAIDNILKGSKYYK